MESVSIKQNWITGTACSEHYWVRWARDRFFNHLKMSWLWIDWLDSKAIKLALYYKIKVNDAFLNIFRKELKYWSLASPNTVLVSGGACSGSTVCLAQGSWPQHLYHIEVSLSGFWSSQRILVSRPRLAWSLTPKDPSASAWLFEQSP